MTRESVGTRRQDREWRTVIRWFAIAMAIVGFILIGNEVWENVSCPALTLTNGMMVRAEYCAKIHLAPMFWGIALLSLGLLIIQRGDVSASLKDFTASGTIVRSWWRPGRGDDPPGTVVRGEMAQPIPEGAHIPPAEPEPKEVG